MTEDLNQTDEREYVPSITTNTTAEPEHTHIVELDGCDDESRPMTKSKAQEYASRMNENIIEEHGISFPHRAHAVRITLRSK